MFGKYEWVQKFNATMTQPSDWEIQDRMEG